MEVDVGAVVAGLSEAQRVYILAVGESDEPYKPRHGRTANWALRNDVVDTVVQFADGTSVFWKDSTIEQRTQRRPAFLGEALTPFGVALRDHLKGLSDG